MVKFFSHLKQWQNVVKYLGALLRHGWYADRQSGSHVILKHPEREDFISFPNHETAEMGKGLMKKILKQAGLKKI